MRAGQQKEPFHLFYLFHLPILFIKLCDDFEAIFCTIFHALPRKNNTVPQSTSKHVTFYGFRTMLNECLIPYCK